MRTLQINLKVDKIRGKLLYFDPRFPFPQVYAHIKTYFYNPLATFPHYPQKKL
jgi:hypothetical protein